MATFWQALTVTPQNFAYVCNGIAELSCFYFLIHQEEFIGELVYKEV
jgi:hypothetical protein